MNRSVATTVLLLSMLAAAATAGDQRRLLADLKASRFRIIHETFRNGNWELVIRNADGSRPVNLTRTPHVDELYPKVSPDGRHIAFVAIEGAGNSRARNLYCMPIDGGERTLVGPHGRQPFWSPDGKTIAFAMGKKATAPEGGYANKGLYLYNIETRALSEAPRADVAGLLAPGFSPDGGWVVASIIDGMGLQHAVAAFTVEGKTILPLAKAHWEHGRPLQNIYQCRPDVSPDRGRLGSVPGSGRLQPLAPSGRIAWGKDDIDGRLGTGRRSMWIEVAHIDLSAPDPHISRYTYPVSVKWPQQTYFVDWSPDGKYIAFSQGPRAKGRLAGTRHALGREAPGWDIRVVTADKPHVVVQITHDGLSNKEPDWVPAPRAVVGGGR